MVKRKSRGRSRSRSRSRSKSPVRKGTRKVSIWNKLVKSEIAKLRKLHPHAKGSLMVKASQNAKKKYHKQ